MSFSEPECNFYGVRLPAGKPTVVTAEFNDDSLETIHLTQVALGEKPKAGPHTIFIEKDGEKFAIGTLDSSKCAQFSMDITLATDTITLSHTGGSDVYVTGYKTVAIHLSDDEDEYGRGPYLGSSDDEGESDEEDDSSDGEGPPRGVPIANGRPPAARRVIDDEAGSSEDEEEESSEDEEEEDNALAMGLGSGSDDSSEEEDGSEEEEEDDSEDEPEPAAKPAQKAGEKKRPAPAAPPTKTPQPPAAKKAKAEQAAAPASAPAKGSASVAAGTASYVTGLKAFLQQNGPTKIAVLGSKVKRTEKVPKLKSVLEQNAKLFKYDAAADLVSLA